eukprot:11288111-Alexandrium_andersonii.AAC.1
MVVWQIVACALALDMSKHFSPHSGGATPPHERSRTHSHRTARRFKAFRGNGRSSSQPRSARVARGLTVPDANGAAAVRVQRPRRTRSHVLLLLQATPRP